MNIFVNAGHSTSEPGSQSHGHKESHLAIELRDKVLGQIASFGTIISVPDNLNLRESIAWVNERATEDDLAFSIHFNANNNTNIKGTEAYYSNDREREMAVIFAEEVAKAGGFRNRGALHDSVLVEICYLSNESDMANYIPNRVAGGFGNALNRIVKEKPDMPSKEDLIIKIGLLTRIVEALKKILDLKKRFYA